MNKLITTVSILALSSASAFAAETKIEYWMWDTNQQPVYQACAKGFEKANPGIKVNIVQRGWDDYWTAITTGMISGTAPDVFVNHLNRYPELAANEQIVDIKPLIEKDKVPTNIYAKGLYELWGREGKQYGLPKDWDTIAIIYNKEMLKAAGITPQDLDNATWNPKDGGTFGQIIAKLSKDKKGNDGTSPQYDPKSVERYGLVINSPDGFGQDSWSPFALSNGFEYYDGPWSTNFKYDDPKLAEAVTWLADASFKKGHMMPIADVSKIKAGPLFTSGKAAMHLTGSWMIRWFADNTEFEFGFARLPTGPIGRKTMFNGLADSIWSGSKHKEESWKWVKYLASPDCQNIVGESGVVFPAIPEAADKAQKAMSARGIDVSAFVDEAKPEYTKLFPIADRMSEVKTAASTAIEAIMVGNAPATPTFKKANDEIKALFN